MWSRVYLAGQSAGAHLAACALLMQAEKEITQGSSELSWRSSQISACMAISGGWVDFTCPEVWIFSCCCFIRIFFSFLLNSITRWARTIAHFSTSLIFLAFSSVGYCRHIKYNVFVHQVKRVDNVSDQPSVFSDVRKCHCFLSLRASEA